MYFFLLFATHTGNEVYNVFSLLDYEFANGCRAPPWRQVHGDISYILVKPSDGDRLSITAATSGYYENKGKTDENEINYERSGDVFPSLVALLKEKSQHFAKTIAKKVRSENILSILFT